MVRRARVLGAVGVLCVLVAGLAGPLAAAETKIEPDSAPPAVAQAEPQDSPEEQLRARLTEREDQRRPFDPWTIPLAGRPLIVGGEYELAAAYLRRRDAGGDRLLLEQGLEAEAFYSFRRPLSLFVQGRAVWQRDLRSGSAEDVSARFVERGEMWLYTENVLDTRLNLDIGRLHFEDDRRWWWDEELDAVRLEWEGGEFELTAALARELASARSDRDWVDAGQERVSRLIAEAQWNWHKHHGAQFFLLRQQDRSATELPSDTVASEREDSSDARLTWSGLRFSGLFELRSQAIVGYWLDAAWLRGDETLIEYDPPSAGRSAVTGVERQRVRGWAADAGGNWLLPYRWEPRLFAFYARGSGDRVAGDAVDRSFHQTGLHGNEAGYGGVERYAGYGIALDPELSNLDIFNIGAGMTVLKSSSLDVLYHRYRLVEYASELRDARFDLPLTGASRDLGQGLDAVLALEEWERLEFSVMASGFRAGRAAVTRAGEWNYMALLAMRYAF